MSPKSWRKFLRPFGEYIHKRSVSSSAKISVCFALPLRLMYVTTGTTLRKYKNSFQRISQLRSHLYCSLPISSRKKRVEIQQTSILTKYTWLCETTAWNVWQWSFFTFLHLQVVVQSYVVSQNEANFFQAWLKTSKIETRLVLHRSLPFPPLFLLQLYLHLPALRQ